MSQQFDNLDRVFKDALGKYEQKPPDEVLNRIKNSYQSNSIPTGNGGKGIFWGIGIFVVVLAGIASVWMLNSEKQNTKAESLIPVENKIVVPSNAEEFNSKLITAVKTENFQDEVKEDTQAHETSDISVPEEAAKAQKGKQANDINLNELIVDAGKDAKLCGLSCKLHASSNVKDFDGLWSADNDKVHFISDVYTDAARDPNATVIVDEPGIYEFTWTQKAFNQTNSDEVQINFYKNSGITLVQNVKAAVCGNPTGSIEVSAEGGDEDYTYIWQDEALREYTTKVDNLLPGIYELQVNDGSGCVEHFSIEVPDSGLVNAGFYVENDIVLNKPVVFKSNSMAYDVNLNQSLMYFWNFGDGNTSNETNPAHVYSNPGSYTVSLIVRSDVGCADTVMIPKLIVSSSRISLPDIFTPNGDGQNDFYRIKVSSIEAFKGMIYNKEGVLIYSWDNPEEGWNGKIDGNDEAAAGVYFCVAKGIDDKGNLIVQKRTITLLR